MNEIKKTNVKQGFDPLTLAKVSKAKDLNSNKQIIEIKDPTSIRNNDIIVNHNPVKQENQIVKLINDTNNQLSYSEPIKQIIKHETEDLYIPHDSLIHQEKAYFMKEQLDYFGTLYLTDSQIIFKFSSNKKISNENQSLLNNLMTSYLFTITKVDKIQDKLTYDKYWLEITFSNMKKFRFLVIASTLKIYTSIINIIYPKVIPSFYSVAKNYKANSIIALKRNKTRNNYLNGWLIYNPEFEYTRQGALGNDKLRVTTVNNNFSISKTYPEFIIAPSKISDKELIEGCNFRTKGRFPTLSYVNNNYSGSLWRSSQPKSGLTNSRNSADEFMLKCIKDFSNRFLIYDARPYINAMGNRVKGGGTEIVENYGNVKLIYCEIDNIHAVTKAYHAMFSINRQDNKSYFKDLYDTKWFEYIFLLLKFSSEIVTNFTKGFSILIHCSDGWDRSTQLIGLSSIMIDPFYRTGKGFAILIEKEFLSFGHQFGSRSGILNKKEDSDQKSPIFIQFLDSVFQITQQFPSSFEFNEEFLLFLGEHFHSLLYGTFLFNNELQRKEQNAKEQTVSIWSDMFYINDNNDEDNQYNYVTLMPKYANPLYNKALNDKIIIPNHNIHSLCVWENYFYPTGNIFDKLSTGQFYEDNADNILSFSKIKNNKSDKNDIIRKSIIDSYQVSIAQSMVSNNDKLTESNRIELPIETRKLEQEEEKKYEFDFTSNALKEDNYEKLDNDELDSVHIEIDINDKLNILIDEKSQLEKTIEEKDISMKEMKTMLNLLMQQVEKGNDSYDFNLIKEIKEKYTLNDSDIV